MCLDIIPCHEPGHEALPCAGALFPVMSRDKRHCHVQGHYSLSYAGA